MAKTNLTFRSASLDELADLVFLLADDAVAAGRESARVLDAHRSAFQAILDNPNHELIVAERNERMAGFAQLSFLPGLTYAGGWRAQIEGVRVAPEFRGQGVGRALIEHAVDRSRDRGCILVQLTTDRRRPRALAFYQRLGFVDSHHGMKLKLGS